MLEGGEPDRTPAGTSLGRALMLERGAPERIPPGQATMLEGGNRPYPAWDPPDPHFGPPGGGEKIPNFCPDWESY